MSTQQPFKFRHLDSIVGAFVLAAVGIVIVTLVLIGSARQWFTSHETVLAATERADPAYEEMAERLRPGTPVEFNGRVVGEVVESASEGQRLRLGLRVAVSVLDLLHRGDEQRAGMAKALINVPLAPFMGQTRVILKQGSRGGAGWLKEKWNTYNVLPIEPPSDHTAMAVALLRDLQRNLGPMMAAITGLVEESRKLVAEVREQRLPQQAGELIAGMRERQVPQRLDALLARIEAIAATGEAVAADVRRLGAGLAEGRGIAGKALTDQRFADDLARIVADLRAIAGELRRAAPAAPALAEGAGSLLDEVQRLVDGLNRHWLLRGYTEPGDGGRIAPAGIVQPPEAKP